MKNKQLILITLTLTTLTATNNVFCAQGLRAKLTHVVAAMRQGLQSRAADSKEIVRLCAQDPAVKKAGNWLLKAPLSLTLLAASFYTYEEQKNLKKMVYEEVMRQEKNPSDCVLARDITALAHYYGIKEPKFFLVKDQEAEARFESIYVEFDDAVAYNDPLTDRETKVVILSKYIHELGHLFYNHLEKQCIVNAFFIHDLSGFPARLTSAGIVGECLRNLLKTAPMPAMLKVVSCLYGLWFGSYSFEQAFDYSQATPLFAYLRSNEREADAFVAVVANDYAMPEILDAFAHLFETHYQESAATPFDSHPSLKERIEYSKQEAAKLRAKLA